MGEGTYAAAFAEQIATAKHLYGEQVASSAAFTSPGSFAGFSSRSIPFTHTLYARAIARWYFDDLIVVVRQMRGANSLAQQGAGRILMTGLVDLVRTNDEEDGFFGNFAVNADNLDASTVALAVFPSSLLVATAKKLRSDPVIGAGTTGRNLADVLQKLGESSAKALAGMETATIVNNAHGDPCLDPLNATRFWEGWRAYANAIRLIPSLIPPSQPSFWEDMKQGVRDIPDNIKKLAEGAGGIAADALVFTGETIGRTAKGFFSELGTDIIWVGGLAYLGWKVL